MAGGMSEMDPDEIARLMEAGQVAFNRGQFFEAHEFWEEIWNEVDDPERTWVQGLIQIATGLHKLAQGRPSICSTLLQKALAKLEGSPPILYGYALAPLRTDATRLFHALARHEHPAPHTLKLLRGTLPSS